MLTSTVCVALTAAGLAIALFTAYRRRFLAATRTAALALLPVGLHLTGLLTLAGEIGRATGSWAADLVFKPSVWVGLAVLAGSVVLYAVARFASRRRKGAARRESVGEQAVSGAPTAAGLPQGGGKPRTRPKSAAKVGTSPKGDDGLSDFREVEEILKRRGI